MSANGPVSCPATLPCGCLPGFPKCPSCRRENAAKILLATRNDRLRAASDALERAGLVLESKRLRYGLGGTDTLANLDLAKAAVSALISRLSDGSDEPRYAAAMTARDALGKLWCVL